MYKQIKWATFIAALINISLSIVLCLLIGLSGIFFATLISKLFTFFWYEPFVLYKKHFLKSPKRYYLDNLINAVLLVVCVSLCWIPIHFITEVSYLTWFLKAAICLIVTFGIYFAFYCKNNSFLCLLGKMKIHKSKNQ